MEMLRRLTSCGGDVRGGRYEARDESPRSEEEIEGGEGNEAHLMYLDERRELRTIVTLARIVTPKEAVQEPGQRVGDGGEDEHQEPRGGVEERAG
jgi:hypothetical protein